VSDLEIECVRVFAVGPDIPRYSWAWNMDEQFMTNTIVQVVTRGGLEGVSGAISFSEHGFSSAVAETLRRMAPDIIGANPLEREALWYRMRKLDFPLAPQAQSLIDIALWDLAAKHARLPLYQLLGGARSRIPSYASTPMMRDNQAYLDLVAELKAQGFRAIKFHCWCDIERDLDMARAVQARFGDDPELRFMLDVEMRYSREQALRAAQALEDLDFAWFEAPLIDSDLRGYRDLRRRVNIPIIPAGNWVLAPGLIEVAIEMGCWTSARIDVTVVGGFTPARQIMSLAAANGMNVEVQSWGYTLTQAANLHLMLAYTNCTYFEQAVPHAAYEYGALDVIRTDSSGHVAAPLGPGLGIRLDWDRIREATFHSYEITGKDRTAKAAVNPARPPAVARRRSRSSRRAEP
jgi:L-alanine-DL-glutamate epimerase-like enolase superfamily enzyme